MQYASSAQRAAATRGPVKNRTHALVPLIGDARRRRRVLVWGLEGGNNEKAKRARCYTRRVRTVHDSDFVALVAKHNTCFVYRRCKRSNRTTAHTYERGGCEQKSALTCVQALLLLREFRPPIVLSTGSSYLDAIGTPFRSVPNSEVVTHSITSSAVASSDEGIVRPSAFAVFKLITNVNLVGCWTGRSEGLAPFKILST